MGTGAIHTGLARRALKHWGIASEPVFVMHRENTVFRVEASKGAAALRIHRAGYHTRAGIEAELSWMAFLAASGIAVPAPLPAADGCLVAEAEDDGGTPRCIDLLGWLPGSPLGQSNAPLNRPRDGMVGVFAAIGAQMARLHNASDRWTIPPGFQRHAWDKAGLVGDSPFWGAFWTVSGLDADETALLGATRERLARDLDALSGEAADYGLIHADLVRENVLVQDADVAFIDFDDSGFGYRLFDVATALHKNRAEPDYPALKAALIEGYRRHRPLSDAALAALPLFTLLRALTYVGWAEARRDEPGMAARQARFTADALRLAKAYLAERGG